MLHKICLLRPNLSRLFLLFVLVLCATAAGSAQLVLDGFDPNANDTIFAVVVQPDGKILIGGVFTTLAPNGGASVTRGRIARLNPDGTLDTAFNANMTSGFVLSMALQADGKVVVGGNFTNIGGQPRNNIARLDGVTGSADSFDPNSTGFVYALAVQSDGKILAGGAFNGANSIGGQTRNRIARLDPATGMADSFDPNANNQVRAITIQPDGKILAGGFFNGANSIGGQARNRIARLDAVTGMADSFDPNANSFINAIAVQADGKVLAGGDFNGANSIGGQTRNRIARLDAATGAADPWNPNITSGGVQSIAVQPDGRILVAGFGFGTIGGQTRIDIARLDPVTGLADSFDPSPGGGTFLAVYSIVVQSDGKILAGGDFSTFAPNGGATVTRNRIARLETDGRLDQTLDISTVGSFGLATAVQPDGKILIGGTFTSVLGVTRNNIARLNTDGTLDTAFNPNANSTVWSIAVQADGKILAGGPFTTIGGQFRLHIARLDAVTGLADSFDPAATSNVLSIAVQADGKILAVGDFEGANSIGGQTRNHIARLDALTGLADSFNPNANNDIRAIALQADGKILVGGYFTSIGGQTRNGIARLDASTGLADSFDPNANVIEVISIAVQADGKILVGGGFTSIGGQARNRIARLDATSGSADLSFDPNANFNVFSIAVQANGKILAGGTFTTIGGQPRNHIARLDATTGAADSFDPNANDIVFSVAVPADGKILAGGNFTSIGGQSRNLFARIKNDTIAVQNLAVSQTNATWTRGGSSPQFARVTFEDSTDGVNYSFLGNGTPSGSNWTLTGLNLTTQQNIYIRARGYYRSGYNNGSESITESVRNAFLSASTPTATNTPTPTATNTGTPTNTPTPCSGSGTFSYTGPAVVIPDSFPAGVNFTIPVSGLGTISDVNFRFDGTQVADPFSTLPGINHSWAGDLIVKVTAPGAGAPTVVVFDRPGFPATAFGCPSNNLAQIVLDDGALPPVEDQCGADTNAAFPTGTFSPNNPLSAFNGINPNGDWIVNISDNASGDNGSARAFSLIIESVCGPPTATNTATATATATDTATPTATVTPVGASISGTVTYGNAAAPPKFISNATVTGAGSPTVMTTTAAPGATAGQYILTGFGGGSYTVSLSKSTGANGISSFDAGLVAKYVVNPSNCGGCGIAGQWRFFTQAALGPTPIPSPFPTPPNPLVSRSYASVTGAMTGQDFMGLLFGEVSGNWTNTGARGVDGRQLAVAVGSDDGGGPESNIAVNLPEVAVSAEKEVVVPVSVQGIADEGIISYEFDLRYDPSVIQPQANAVDVAGTASRGLSVVTNADEPGLLRVVLYGPMAIDEDGLLLNLRFTAVGTPGSVSPLAFEKLTFNEGAPSVTVTAGKIEIVPTAASEAERR